MIRVNPNAHCAGTSTRHLKAGSNVHPYKVNLPTSEALT